MPRYCFLEKKQTTKEKCQNFSESKCGYKICENCRKDEEDSQKRR